MQGVMTCKIPTTRGTTYWEGEGSRLSDSTGGLANLENKELQGVPGDFGSTGKANGVDPWRRESLDSGRLLCHVGARSSHEWLRG
jgi:hypothetical protein